MALGRVMERSTNGARAHHGLLFAARLTLVALLVASAFGCGDGGGDAPPPVPPGASQCPDANPSATGSCGPTFVLPSWGDAGGWRDASYYSTIQLADLDGDGKAELIGRSPAGIATSELDVATGQWMPLTSEGSGLALTLTLFADPPPLGWGTQPSTDWRQPAYYTSIQTVHILPGKGRQLVARSAFGLVVYSFTPGTGWEQLTHEGPMADSDCFANGKCWNSDASYYATIQAGDLNGDGNDEVIGRGADGIEVYCWSGGWKKLATLTSYSDALDGGASDTYPTIRLADVDGDGRQEIFVRGVGGVRGHRFSGGSGCADGSWSRLDGDPQPFCNVPDDSDCFDAVNGVGAQSDPSYYETIQLADIDGEKGDELLGRMPDGLRAYKWNGRGWSPLPTNTVFTDQAGWKAPQYYTTLHSAKLEGAQAAQIVGRGAAGIYAATYANGAWGALEQNTTLTLEDDPWAASASYYRTIQAGDVDGDGRDDLIGRGPYGLRTWFFDRRSTGAWESFLPYGYPAFASAGQRTALAALTDLAKNLPQTCSPLPQSDPSVRSRYDGTDQGITVAQVQAYGGCLQGAEGCNCEGEEPPFAHCTPPARSGVSEADWTAVCNQILREAVAAENVLTVFDHIQNIESSLFLSESVTLPGIVSDLKLHEAGSNPSSSFDLLGVFESMLEAAGSIAGIFDPAAGAGLSTAGELMTSVISGTPSLSERIDTTYDQLQMELASRVNDAQKTFAANQDWVLGDQGLLTAVGELGSSKGAWQKVDEIGMESVGRYGFARWVYQTLLPQYWQRQQISNCVTVNDPQNDGCFLSICNPLAQAPNITAYAPGGASFTALVSSESQLCVPCASRECPNCTSNCSWPTQNLPSSDTIDMIFGSLSPTCAYVPGNANTVWTWPSCSLGIASDPASSIFTNRNGWNFPVVSGNPVID